jgi:tetratricopeptide (TPR) repeat protein
MRSTLFLAWSLALLFVSCNQKYPEGALRISTGDSTYGTDILTISEKINKSPFEANKYYLRGNTFFYQDKFKLAIKDFRTAIKLEPKNPLYRYRAAETYLQEDSANYLGALEQIDEAIDLKQDYHEAILLKSKLLLARQQYQKCDPLLIKLTKTKDFKEQARLLHIVSLKEQGDTVKAMQLVDLILADNPDNYDASMQKALFLLDKDSSLAEKWIDKALVLDEYSDEALYTKGLLLQRKGQYADAEIIYNRVIKINPAHLYAFYNLAVIQALFDNHEDVIELCTQIIEQNQGFVKAYVLRGFSLKSTGQEKAAQKDFQAALSLEPNNELAKKYLED